MTLCKVLLLLLNSWIIVGVFGDGEFDKDVEIITGKEMQQQQHPLDAKFAGHSSFPNDIYGPPVSVNVPNTNFISISCNIKKCDLIFVTATRAYMESVGDAVGRRRRWKIW